MQIQVKVLENGEGLELPSYESAGASGMDLRAALEEGIILYGGHSIMVPTGLAVAIPRGYEIQVRSRSGLAAKSGIFVLNSPGTIDADYRGEIKVILRNTSDQPFEIKRGDRIAQMVVAPIIQAQLVTVQELDKTSRGEGGFGSTGV